MDGNIEEIMELDQQTTITFFSGDARVYEVTFRGLPCFPEGGELEVEDSGNTPVPRGTYKIRAEPGMNNHLIFTREGTASINRYCIAEKVELGQ